MKRCIFLQGGLGNQMFGYAFFLVLKQMHPPVRVSTYFFDKHHDHNGLEIDRIFPLRLARAGSIVPRLYWKLYYTSLRPTLAGKCCAAVLQMLYHLHAGLCVEQTTPDGTASSDIANPRYRMYLGYWATEHKRFDGIGQQIRQHFRWDTGRLSTPSKALLHELAGQAGSISVHVRRGDYLKNPQFLDVCNAHYYRKAVEVMNTKVANARFYVFSDDTAWAKQNLPLPPGTTYIDWNTKEDSWQDMCLMAHCRHNIIANSTFSWWGAWLNSHPEKVVICPREYSRTQNLQIMPQAWIQL